MSVPFLDLKLQYQQFKDELQPLLDDLYASQQFVLGIPVSEFESTFAQYCGSAEAIGVSSGTDALMVSLQALGVGPGDEVITSAFTFVASGSSISALGAKPVFVDIDPETFNLNPKEVLNKITKKTKVVIPVHLFGLSADMNPLLEIARETGVAIVEDACQSAGAEYQQQKVGTFGTTGCFSFFPTKNLGGFGDGGMVITDNEALAEQIRMIRVHGSKERYRSDIIGRNLRLDALQAIVLDVKLKYLDQWNNRRREIAHFYNEKLKPLPVTLPLEHPGYHSVYNQYTIRVEERDKLIPYLEDKGIGYSVYYPIPLHLQPCYAFLGYAKGDFPESEKAAETVLSLPIFPELTQKQLNEVVQALEGFYAQVR